MINSLGGASTSSTTSVSSSTSSFSPNDLIESNDRMIQKNMNLNEEKNENVLKNNDKKENEKEKDNDNNDFINDDGNGIDTINKINFMKEKNNFNNNLISVDILTKECKSTVLSERTILKECPICFEEPELSSLVITTCGHILCLLCAKTLINKNKQCPICSHPLGIHLRLRIFFFFLFFLQAR